MKYLFSCNLSLFRNMLRQWALRTEANYLKLKVFVLGALGVVKLVECLFSVLGTQVLISASHTTKQKWCSPEISVLSRWRQEVLGHP